MKLDPWLIPYKKINSRYNEGLNVSTKFLGENLKELLSNLKVQKHFYEQDTEDTNHKRDNLYIQLVIS